MVYHYGLVIINVYPLVKPFKKDMECVLMTHCKIISMLSEYFPLELSLKLRFCKFVKGILLKGYNLIKHVVGMAQHNRFLVYSNNCNELADKCVILRR